MQVAAVKVRAERIERERNLTWRVRPSMTVMMPAARGALDDLLDGKDDRRRAGDVAEKNDARARRDRTPKQLNKICPRFQRDNLVDISKAALFGEEIATSDPLRHIRGRWTAPRPLRRVRANAPRC